ncbi:MAG: ribonuclease H-like domain-containing protein [Armatimonadota bacterium]
MLTSTFIHVPGIGRTTERRIWELGVSDWDRFLEVHPELAVSDAKKALMVPVIGESVDRLAARDSAYFARMLPSGEHWRAVTAFPRLAYLDIETTGCGHDDEITVIGLYDGVEMSSFIRGRNLDEFPEAVSRFETLVTFFGSGFDLPVIRRCFPGIPLPHLHVDLCFTLRKLGLGGGLKSIEGQLGISRRPGAEGLSGYDAVRLWHEYRRGSSEALDLLLLYNEEDVMNMKYLLSYACGELAEEYGPFSKNNKHGIIKVT